MSDLQKFIFRSSYLNGEWVSSERRFPVNNPSTGELVGLVDDAGEEQVESAIHSANAALPAWKSLLASERADFLMRWYSLILQHEKELAALLTTEQGKPFREALGEIRYGASFISWFAGEAVRIYGDVLMPTHSQRRMMVLRQPLGVVGAITPWNFPNAMITRKVAPALAAGCTVVLKPSELTPLSALALAFLAGEAGFPPGVFNVLVAQNPHYIGERFCSDPRMAKLTFTGSTRVGRSLASRAGNHLKKLSLELGGNAPFIVFDDADLASAAEGLIASKFRNNGQTCICTNRVLVHQAVKEEFIRILTAKVSSLKWGDGMGQGVDIGPLVSVKALDKVMQLQEDALSKGGRLICGGRWEDGLFYPPTVIDDGNPDMSCFRDEIFGPLLVIYPFESDEQALNLANDTHYGLAAYFYTTSVSRVFRFSESLEYGMVGVNNVHISDASAPFGGVKHSGQGREGSKYGMDEFLEKKLISVSL